MYDLIRSHYYLGQVMIKEDLEYYQRLEKDLTTHGRWFIAAMFGFSICIGLAFDAGPNAGWPWLLGSLVALMITLWARIDEQHTRVLMRIYLASVS